MLNKILLLASVAVLLGVHQTVALPKLGISTNKHYLITADGSPFFWLGDTGWWLLKLSNSDITYYMNDRVAKGFNGILVEAVMETGDIYGWPDTDDYNGQPPFTDNNSATPNAAYWDRLDAVIDEAGAKGLYFGMFVMWANCYADYFGTDAQKAYDFGYWLGNRYKSKTNVWWSVCGEYDAINGYKVPITSAQKTMLNSMANGLNAGHGNTQLMSIHPGVARTSIADFHNETLLDFDMLQSGHYINSYEWDNRPENHALILSGYNTANTKPIVDGEPIYEDIPDGVFHGGGSSPRAQGDVMRRKAWWAVFSGAFGHTYGHANVMSFWAGTYTQTAVPYLTAVNWKTALNAEGAQDMQHVGSFMNARSFLNRVPDQSIITSSNPLGNTYAVAARESDGSNAMVYIPDGRAVTVDLSKLSGPGVEASWFSPRDGSWTAITGTFTNSGTQSFDGPGATALGNDWVLFLTSAAASNTVATPSISPGSGAYAGVVGVSITCATSGATVRYTTDGSTPTSSSTAYSGAFSLTNSTTVKAKAFKDGMTESNTASASFTIVGKPSLPFYMNCGPTVPAVSGWTNDDGYMTDGDDYSTDASFITDGVTDAAPADLYKTCSRDEPVFAIPVDNGTYTVRLHFAEPAKATVAEADAARHMTVLVEGATVLSDFSPAGAAGAVKKAYVYTLETTVSDGSLDVLLQNGSGNDSFIMGIEVLEQPISAISGYRMPAAHGNTGIHRSADLEIYDMQGVLMQDTGGLPNGVYIIKSREAGHITYMKMSIIR